VQKDFTRFIGKHNLCSRTQPVFVAVSGGIDSMVLLHLFKSSGYNVTAVHVNFGLRGEESDEDEVFIQRSCMQWEVGFIAKRVLTKDYATDKGLSIQMAARELRYEWFKELTEDTPGSVLATAHHVNDSGETMIMNLVRGTGIDGLTGIPIRNNNIIRPLAFASRDEIKQYATSNDIAWREDRSNSDDHYQRNFIRHRVMPLLKEINPSLEETLLKNFSRLGGERELMEMSVARLKENFFLDQGSQIHVPKKALDGFVNKAGILLRLIEEFGFNLSHAESIVAAMDGQPGKMFFSDTHALNVDREDLIISSLQIPGIDFETYETNDLSFSNDPEVAYLDADKVEHPLEMRRWREGDSFQPLGMRGTKKVSDYLIDTKLSLLDKQKVMVITSKDQIVWLVGHRIDDRFKITSGTKRVLIIKKARRTGGLLKL
jgi:tRNA(Ile)-lysidine synthase